MDLKQIISEIHEEADRLLLNTIRSKDVFTGENIQSQTILQMRMVDRLIESLDKNSKSSDRLARGLNWLTGVIALASCAAAFAGIVQFCK
jgi:hypothetical protein